MQTYEYMTWTPELKGFIKKKPSEDIDESLNGFGAMGWELISVVPITANMGTSYGGTTGSLVYCFKRPTN